MDHTIVEILKNGGVGVIPTDTIYGMLASALNQEAVEKVYKIKDRSPDKPPIILISSLKDLTLFNIHPEEKLNKFLQQNWPNPLSVVIPCPEEKFTYLHRGTQTLAFRMPKDDNLLDLLSQTGPLIAPSANPESKPPAETIDEAKRYFGDPVNFGQTGVNFYIDGGRLKGHPSTLIKINEDEVEVIRKGAFQLNSFRIS